jgi:hypothetical protein
MLLQSDQSCPCFSCFTANAASRRTDDRDLGEGQRLIVKILAVLLLGQEAICVREMP